ncbi:hypothetical protein QE152_g40704 [Popillia japonica]|uniref:Uncharacterized protein n=1 Tax=Popillia japonica TaxID=7064 RepID=A0AAW1HFD7_POPJA
MEQNKTRNDQLHGSKKLGIDNRKQITTWQMKRTMRTETDKENLHGSKKLRIDKRKRIMTWQMKGTMRTKTDKENLQQAKEINQRMSTEQKTNTNLIVKEAKGKLCNE